MPQPKCADVREDLSLDTCPAFIRCNTRKGNRLPQQAGMSLIRKPKRPKWQPFLHITWGKGQHDESWRHFVDVAYWNVELSD